MPRRFSHPILWLSLWSLLLGTLPPAVITAVEIPAGEHLSPAPAAVVAAPPPAPLMVLPNPGNTSTTSTGLLASQAVTLRQQSGGRHAVNGVFDGSFSASRAVSYVAPDQGPLNNGTSLVETILPVPAGIHSVDLTVTIVSNDPTRGA